MRYLLGAAFVALAVNVVPAQAQAEGCPNEQFRTGLSAALPECRAYELVSPASKSGKPVTSVMRARDSGGAVAFHAPGAFAGSPSSLLANYKATRGAAGWATTPLNPPMLGPNPSLFDTPAVVELADDFSRALILTTYPVDARDAAVDTLGSSFADVYRYEPGGSFTWLSHGATLPDARPLGAGFAGASGDLERVVFETRRPLTPDVPSDTTTLNVYARVGDDVHLISVAPDGTRFASDVAVGGASSNQFPLLTSLGGHYPSAVSDDATRVVLAVTPASPRLYVRTDALDPATAATIPVSFSQAQATAGEPCPKATFLAATRNVATVWFSCATALTDDATPGGGVYAFDVATRTLRFLTPETPRVEGSYVGAGQLQFVAADPDGSHIYFESPQRLTDDPVTPLGSLYDLHGDRVTRVAEPLSAGEQAEATPDGKRLVFESRAPLIPGYDPAGFKLVYLYDGTANAGERLTCVSCRAGGGPARGQSGLTNASGLQEFVGPNARPHGNVSADGRRVFFTSADRLLPQATNGEMNAYEWLDGKLHLLSSGRDPYPSIFAGASADGRDAYILTHESLLPQDVDISITDIYVARVGGGLPAPPTEGPACGSSDECQGAAPAAPALAPIATLTFPGAGDAPPPAAKPKASFSARPSVRGRRFTLQVRTPGAGRIAVRGRYLKAARRRAGRAGTYRVRVALDKGGRKRLARKRRVRVRPRVTFTASGGRASSRTLEVTLRLPTAKRGRGR